MSLKDWGRNIGGECPEKGQSQRPALEAGAVPRGQSEDEERTKKMRKFSRPDPGWGRGGGNLAFCSERQRSHFRVWSREGG